MTWYNTGTVAVTNSTSAVVGTGTSWIANGAAGMGWRGPDRNIYEVASVNSDTSITLATAYQGSTASGQIYSLVPTQDYIRSLASQVASLISTYSTIATNAGAGKFGDGSAAGPGVTFGSNTNTGFYKASTNSIGIAANGSQVATVSAAGIAVGWTAAGSDIQGLAVENNAVSAVSTSSMHFGYGLANYYGFRLSNVNNPSVTAGGLLKIQRGTSLAWVDDFTIDNAGNVGIGISSPAVSFHIYKTAGTVEHRIENSTTGGVISRWKGAGADIGYASQLNILTGSGSTSDFAIGALTNLAFVTAGVEQFRLNSAGSVLMGSTTNPNSAKLHVTSAIGQNIASFVQQAVGGYCAQFDAYNASSTYYLQLFKAGGTTTGSITSNGTTTSYTTTSDHRLKSEVQPLAGSGAFIDALRPKSWLWNCDGSSGVGFIAHEVQMVSPGSVVGTKNQVDDDGQPIMQSVAYGSAEFVAHIVAELQSLRSRVEVLELAAIGA